MVEGAQRMGAMGDFIDERLAAGAQRIEEIRAAADRIEKGFESALEQLPDRLQARGATDARSIEAVRGEIRRIQREDVGPGFQALASAVAPTGRLIDDLQAGSAAVPEGAQIEQERTP